MKFLDWNRFKNEWSDKTSLGCNLLFLFSLIYIISTGSDHLKFKLPLLIIGISFALFFVKRIEQPLLWYIFLAILLFDLISGYSIRANHHFLLIYLTVAVITYLHNGKAENLSNNVKLLLAIVLIFSGLQKLLSPQFISGEFTYYMLNTGKFFKPLLNYNQDIQDIIINNNEQISELNKTDPNKYASTQLQDIIPNLGSLSLMFAYFAIGFEILAGFLILWKPKLMITHTVFVLLIIGVFLTRLENGFLALLSISGIWLTDHLRFKVIYSLMAIMFLSLIIAKIGFY